MDQSQIAIQHIGVDLKLYGDLEPGTLPQAMISMAPKCQPKNFNCSNHVSPVIKSTRVQARDLYRIHPLLDLNTSVLLANALVSSRLDYCNSLFLSLTDVELRRLQLVQNALCRVITRSSKFSHIYPSTKKTSLATSQIQGKI